MYAAIGLLVGCGSDTVGLGDAGTDDGSVGRPEPGLDASTSDPACQGPGYFSREAATAIHTYRGRVVDQDGNGAEDIPAQACGINVCLFGVTDQDGNVELTVSETPVEKPRFKYGKGKSFPMFALPMAGGPVIDVGEQLSWRLPDVSTSAPLGPGEVSYGAVTLSIAPTARIRIDLLSFDDEDEQGFRAARIPLDKAPSAVDASLGIEVLYSLNPIDSMFCPRAQLQLPKSESWPPGTEVDVLLHGTRIQEEWAPYGGWAEVSAASVSSDGASIDTVADEGIPMLGVIGLRRAR